MTTVTKIFKFEACHNLPHYEGACHNLHGHSYKLEVTVGGTVETSTNNPKCGMIVDFKDLHFRVGPPYTMRHLPWYMDSKNPTEEDLFYFSKISTSTHWSEKEKK